MESFTVSTTLPVKPEQIYKAWISSEEHSQMTGSHAEVDAKIDGEFKAWDGYIWGKTLIMEPYQRIVQAWRTGEFPEGSPDSQVEVLLDDIPNGTKITLNHKDIPDGQGDNYKQGWEDFYFTPMRAYFSK